MATTLLLWFDSKENGDEDHQQRKKKPSSETQVLHIRSKRKGYLSWDDYFMAIAFLSAERSKDPNSQVGAYLVSENGIILGISYNGFPRGCSDDKLSWAKKSINGDPLETKYPDVCHAEVNAISNTNHASAAGQELNCCGGHFAPVCLRSLLGCHEREGREVGALVPSWP